MMAYFRQSGKKIIGYCSGGAEKELYFALGNYSLSPGYRDIEFEEEKGLASTIFGSCPL